ncbi:benzoate-CoA ligase family protein [Denitromonas iodatirespirans]|uniref:Benzoate-CoA ligase family protein n=1 Tax=Denitromonas iodatirespirans TaxID=2795389 RepID=A0A944HAU0_DENI1|nr:benzoate-CoA ligase family protein [Denitromonas iodatirespirans]MBT0963820.1 benzoate-CoA ligase family protein [Denitromonas iodatirespirans]
MPELSQADHSVSPPIITIPRSYNAAADLLGRNLAAGRGDKTAFIDDRGRCTYAELDRRSSACANALRALGLMREQRVLMCLHDTIDFPTVFLGAIKAGIVPVAVNTLLTRGDYEYMLRDSRARVAVVSAALMPLFEPLLDEIPSLERIIVSGGADGPDALARLIADQPEACEIADTLGDEVCFWLYSSGSTGAPKGTTHRHSSLIATAELFARPILGICEQDTVFSAAKLFFAYGLGNGLTFPMSVGATTVLMAERPTPAAVAKRLVDHQPTLFYGVPTLFASMLASADLPDRAQVGLRLCTSAGEALPEEIGLRWRRHFEVDILDGIGSTEMLHVFLSNRRGDVRYGTTGRPVPGYDIRLVDEDGRPVAPGEVGELQVRGPTASNGYWNNRAKTCATFLGDWTRSGDKYSLTEDGYYVYAGRSDDMLKVSGIYVSPIEVESVLVSHEAVLEAAVVGCEDDDQLIKPKAFIVLKPEVVPSEALADQLKAHVKSLLAPYKYPRWFEFVEELPKTATGKIQRFKLRRRA